LDANAILAHLGITDADTVEPLTGGMDTSMWRVLLGDRFYALRVFRPEQAETCEREVAAMEVARAGGVTVPAVIRRGVWENRPVLLLSWISGEPLARALPKHPAKICTLGTAFGREQAAIHRLNPPAQFDSHAWIEWAGDEPEIKARLYNLPSRRTRLIHLDYHPLNVMAEGTRISGVLDWANARAGDPRADFARTYTILRVEPYGPKGDSPLMAVVRRVLERAWRRGYLQAGGALDEMSLFYAWAGAVMVRDLSPRIGRPDSWMQAQHLDPVRAWTAAWKRRAEVSR
jgi:aminoglycoside phosphotransferase (APT) family kinase protein